MAHIWHTSGTLSIIAQTPRAFDLCNARHMALDEELEFIDRRSAELEGPRTEIVNQLTQLVAGLADAEAGRVIPHVALQPSQHVRLGTKSRWALMVQLHKEAIEAGRSVTFLDIMDEWRIARNQERQERIRTRDRNRKRAKRAVSAGRERGENRRTDWILPTP